MDCEFCRLLPRASRCDYTDVERVHACTRPYGHSGPHIACAPRYGLHDLCRWQGGCHRREDEDEGTLRALVEGLHEVTGKLLAEEARVDGSVPGARKLDLKDGEEK